MLYLDSNTMPDLTERQKRFALLYVAGDPPYFGNGVRCYMKAWYDVEDEPCTTPRYKHAGVQAGRVLRKPGVRVYMREARAEAERAHRERLLSWHSLAPGAQETLEAARRGELRPNSGDSKLDAEIIRSQVRASQEILDRALGTTKQMHEHQVVGQAVMVHVAGPGEDVRLAEPTVPLELGPGEVEVEEG